MMVMEGMVFVFRQLYKTESAVDRETRMPVSRNLSSVVLHQS